MIQAWIAAAPSPPLPRCLAALELARIARHHGIIVRVEMSRAEAESLKRAMQELEKEW